VVWRSELRIVSVGVQRERIRKKVTIHERKRRSFACSGAPVTRPGLRKVAQTVKDYRSLPFRKGENFSPDQTPAGCVSSVGGSCTPKSLPLPVRRKGFSSLGGVRKRRRGTKQENGGHPPGEKNPAYKFIAHWGKTFGTPLMRGE